MRMCWEWLPNTVVGFRVMRLPSQNSPILSRGSSFLCYNLLMDLEPNTDNIAYMDEYPHIEEKLRLRRLAIGRQAVAPAVVYQFPMNPAIFRRLMEEAPHTQDA